MCLCWAYSASQWLFALYIAFRIAVEKRKVVPADPKKRLKLMRREIDCKGNMSLDQSEAGL